MRDRVKDPVTAMMPFLTLEDPNAKIKGSRDPLGVQPIWSHFARRLVVNLTTVTTSVRGFTIVMLARYLTERLVNDGRIGAEDALSAFLRVEQLGAYARHVGHGVEGDIRGIERLKAFLESGKGRVTTGLDKGSLILADQKVYGLWGLYSVAARTSGLIADGAVGLTPQARSFIESEYLPKLSPGMSRLLELAAKGGPVQTRKPDAAFRSLVDVLGETFSDTEEVFYAHHLRDALDAKPDHPRERQGLLAGLLQDHTDLEAPLGRDEAVRLARIAEGVDEGLSRALWRVVHLEALLAPAMALFDFILFQNAQRLSDVANDLTKRWGRCVPNLDRAAFEGLHAEIQDASRAETATAMLGCHSALANGAWEEAIESLLQWNALVSEDRKSAPWVRLAEGRRLEVQHRGSEQLLPDGDELGTLWRNTYFVDALKAVTRQLRRAA